MESATGHLEKIFTIFCENRQLFKISGFFYPGKLDSKIFHDYIAATMVQGDLVT